MFYHYCYAQAKRFADSLDNAIWTNQFDNTANRQAHYETTGPEIWCQTGMIGICFVSSKHHTRVSSACMICIICIIMYAPANVGETMYQVHSCPEMYPNDFVNIQPLQKQNNEISIVHMVYHTCIRWECGCSDLWNWYRRNNCW